MKTIERRLNRKVQCLGCMLLIASIATATEQSPTSKGTQAIEEYVNEHNEHLDSARPVMRPFKHLDEIKAGNLPALEKYLDGDPSSRAYEKAWGLLGLIVKRSSHDTGLRRVAIDAILERSKITDTSSCYRFISEVKQLCNCRPEDFTPRSKQLILENLRILDTLGHLDEERNNDTILIVGVANIPEALPFLAEVEQRARAEMRGNLLEMPVGNVIFRTVWYCLQVRARLGDKTALQQILDKFDKCSNAEDWRQMLGSLAFTRSREAVQRIVTVLNSDELVHAVESPDVPVGMYARGALRAILPDFPKDPSLTVEQAREWMKKNGATCRIAP